jgi:hypothetical protein
MKCGNSMDGGALPCCLFLTLLHDGDNISGANDALLMTVADNNDCRVEDGALPA